MNKTGLALAVLLAAAAGQVNAAVVLDTEPNDSFGTAQNIDAYFTLDFDADIGNTTMNTSTLYAHATVVAAANATSQYDYFSFTVSAPTATVILDIDYGMPDFDPWIQLYSSSGTLIAINDDGGTVAGAGGSIHHYDSYMEFSATGTHGPELAAGSYVVGVGRFSGFGPIPAGGDYKLQVSVEGHGLMSAPVPEPASLAVWGLGAIGLAAAARRRSKQAA